MKKILPFLIAIMATFSANADAVQGAYAYDLKLTDNGDQYTFSFRVSASASNASITLTNKSTNATLTYDYNGSVSPNNTYEFHLSKSNFYAGDYTWAVSIDNKASDAYSKYHDQGGTANDKRGGVAIDLDTESPYFGYVYTSMAKSGGGIQRYNPDLSKIGEVIHSDKFNPNKSGSPYRIKANSGKLYIADYADEGNSGIYVYNPVDGSFNQMFQGTRASNGQWTNNGSVIGGSMTGIAFYGEGTNRKMLAQCEDFYSTSTIANNWELLRYDLGTSDTWDKAPSKTYPDITTILSKHNVEIFTCEKGVWLCQNTYNVTDDANSPSFIFMDFDGNVKFNSASLSGDGAIDYAFESGIAINQDMTRLAVAGGGDNINLCNVKIYKVSWNGDTPTLTFDYEIDLGHNTKTVAGVEQIVFDPAGNLLLFSRQKGLLAYAIKNDARKTVTNAPSSQVATGTAEASLGQVTEESGDNKKYSFNLKIDVPYPKEISNAINTYVVTSSENIYNELNNSSFICLDGNGNDITSSVSVNKYTDENIVLVAENGNRYTVEKPCIVFTFTDNSSTTLPTIEWKNVNPTLKYDITLHVASDYECNLITSLSEEMTIPTATLSMTEIGIQPLDGDYSSLQSDELLPLGAKRKVGSNEVTNPVSLNNANTLGTRGSAINPLMVTDEVLENWHVQYKCVLRKNGEYLNEATAPRSDEAFGENLYSNTKKTTLDIIGFPVKTEVWDTHTVMGLSDDQKATNDNITRQKYDKSTADDNYAAYIVTTYYRKSDDLSVERDGVTDAIADIPMSSILSDDDAFPQLDVNFSTPVALFKRTSTHWDASCTTNGGYYSTYYDAAAQWSWDDYTDNLNRYVGYHAVTNTDCVGHYHKDADGNVSNEWIPYYAPSVITDYYVEQINATLSKDGNANPNPEGETLHLEEIGYDGTATTNWSKLAADARTLPMEVHYVWAGNRDLSNSEEDRQSITMPILLTADYPVIEGFVFMYDEYVDGENYSISPSNKTMKVISTSQTSPVYATYVANTTGLENVVSETNESVKLYPNPVENSFTLNAPSTINEVKIFTTDGKLVKEINNCNHSTIEINVEELPQGVYIVNTLGVSQMMIKM